MTDRIGRLSEREKQVLRLLAQGHDVKSAARSLGLSVHVVNERLRDARAKLEVTSSRVAARLLAQQEGGQEICPEKIGLGEARSTPDDMPRPGRPVRGLVHLVTGVLLMSIGALLAILFLSATPDPTPPSVVATTPAAGSTVPPGPFALTVTYNQPMRGDSFSVVRVSPETYPACDRFPSLSADRRTFTLRCAAEPGRTYEIWFNRGRFRNFRSEAGLTATPYRLTFSTR